MRKKPRIITRRAKIRYNKNDNFVFIKCIIYFLRLKKIKLNCEAMEFICWLMGDNYTQIGKYLVKEFNNIDKKNFEKELIEVESDLDDYARAIFRLFLKLNNTNKNKFNKYIRRVLEDRLNKLKYNGISLFEKNFLQIKKMFAFSDQENELFIFLFISDLYEKPHDFFKHKLECLKLVERKKLSAILDIKYHDLNKIITGKFVEIGIISDDDYSELDLDYNFLKFFYSSSSNIKCEQFFY